MRVDRLDRGLEFQGKLLRELYERIQCLERICSREHGFHPDGIESIPEVEG